MRQAGTMAAIVTAVALVGCGGGSGLPAAGGGDGGGDDLTCGGTTFPDADLTALDGVDTLPDEVAGAVDDTGEPVVDPAAGWGVAARSDDEVVLLRAVDGGPAAAGGDTHEALRLAPAPSELQDGSGRWFVWSAGSCTLRTSDALGREADVRLADTPSPEDTELTLLVNERQCASGRDAEGRIDLDELTLTEDEVRVRVSVRPAGGDQECPGNPWTPFTLDLGEPLGDRTVVDAGLVPATPLAVGIEEAVFDPGAEGRDAAVERAVALDVWPDYTMTVETSCSCPAGTYRVVVRAGEVVARQVHEADGPVMPGGGEVDAVLAPSLGELLARLDELWSADPAHVTDIAVGEDGLLVRLALDPDLEAVDDEVAYVVAVDVDSPGDPVPNG